MLHGLVRFSFRMGAFMIWPNIPPVDVPHSTRSNSWVVVDDTTGKVVIETFSQKQAEQANGWGFTVETMWDYLPRVNQRIKRNGGVS